MKHKPTFHRFCESKLLWDHRDYHIHTHFTDGKDSPEIILTKAKQNNLRSIAFTEHVRKDSDYFPKFYEHIDELRQGQPIEIFIGAETKVIDYEGNLDISEENYRLAEIVLGSIHRIGYRGKLMDLKQLDKEKAFQEEYNYSMALIERENIDVLAHPAGMSLNAFGEFPIQYLEEMIRTIAETQIAFELNSRYIPKNYLKKIIDICAQYNPFISLGSDHHVDEIGNTQKMVECITW